LQAANIAVAANIKRILFIVFLFWLKNKGNGYGHKKQFLTGSR